MKKGEMPVAGMAASTAGGQMPKGAMGQVPAGGGMPTAGMAGGTGDGGMPTGRMQGEAGAATSGDGGTEQVLVELRTPPGGGRMAGIRAAQSLGVPGLTIDPDYEPVPMAGPGSLGRAEGVAA